MSPSTQPGLSPPIAIISAETALRRLRSLRIASARSIVDQLATLDESSSILQMYRRHFPKEYARSRAKTAIPTVNDEDGYSERELEFLKLVDRKLFPLNDWLVDSERLSCIPIDPQGIDWEDSCGDQVLFRYREREGATACKFLSASAVRAAFAEEPIDTGWLSPTVRRCGMGKLGEWVMVAHPPQHYTLSIQMRERDEAAELQVPMPRLAFFGHGQKYYIWAFKDKDLKGESIMFAAPLPNVDANGAICFGSNTVPDASTQTIDAAWQIFLTSPFNNHLLDRKSIAFADHVRQQLNRLAVEKRRRYPVSDLVSTNRTADMVVNWVLREFTTKLAFR
jgi:PRTRC genetic system protein B